VALCGKVYADGQQVKYMLMEAADPPS
jgi:hypothetical protein